MSSYRNFIVAMVIVICCSSQISAISAAGSSMGSLTTASPIGMGRGAFALGVGIADVSSVFGSFAYGLSRYTEGRVRFGIADDDSRGSDASIVFGVDFKYQLWDVGSTSNSPFDMAIGSFVEYSDFDAFSVLLLGGQFIGSYPVVLRGGGKLTPYGRFNVRLESLDFSNVLKDDESNLEFGLNGGVAWQVSPNFSLYGEFQLDGNDGLFFGIDFRAL